MLIATETRKASVHGRFRNPSTKRSEVVKPTSNSAAEDQPEPGHASSPFCTGRAARHCRYVEPHGAQQDHRQPDRAGAVPRRSSRCWSPAGSAAADAHRVRARLHGRVRRRRSGLPCGPASRCSSIGDREDARSAQPRTMPTAGLLLVISFVLTVGHPWSRLPFSWRAVEPEAAADKMLIVATLVLVWTVRQRGLHAALCPSLLHARRRRQGQRRARFPGTQGAGLWRTSSISPSRSGLPSRPPTSTITSPHIRQVVTVHCIAAFVFNLGVLALTINVLGSR